MLGGRGLVRMMNAPAVRACSLTHAPSAVLRLNSTKPRWSIAFTRADVIKSARASSISSKRTTGAGRAQGSASVGTSVAVERAHEDQEASPPPPPAPAPPPPAPRSPPAPPPPAQPTRPAKSAANAPSPLTPHGGETSFHISSSVL